MDAQDLDFNRFLAKYVGLEAEGRKLEVNEVLTVHRKLLQTLSTCEPWFGWPLEISIYDGHCILVQDQPQYHKLKPLYRALLMVIEEETEINGEKTLVKLVRTGVTVGLSAPINFEEFGKPNEDVITLTLEQALDLVIRLENKEEEAFPRQDITILHRHLGATPSLKNSGYTDKPIVGPSSDWFKDEV